MVAQAMSGVMSITGQPESPPTRAGIPISDVTASLMAVTGILAGLVARSQTGRGQHVDISMLDSQVSALNYMAAISLLSGELPERLGNAHRSHVPYEVYACKDGYIILAVVTDEFWHNLTQTLDLGELDSPENRARAGRLNNREKIDQSLKELFATQNKKYWLEKLRVARIPCAPVNNFNEAFDDPQVKARNMIVEVEYPQGQLVRMAGNPIKLSETYADTFTPSPLLGQHNKEIFGELLGKSEADLADLKDSNVI
jgi:crotonobetainyl-CoA:carnitine CoA-transferase CaiB-like acyl-CoA transferase